MSKKRQISQEAIKLSANNREGDFTVTEFRKGNRHYVSLEGQYKDKKKEEEKK